MSFIHNLERLEQKGQEVRAQLFGFRRPRSCSVVVGKHKFKHLPISKHAAMHSQRCRYGNCQSSAYHYADFCDEHAKQIYKVEIKQSTIPDAGLGIFALDNFDEKDTVDLYEGKRIKIENSAQSNLPYGFLLKEHNCVVDAASTQSCISRYINHNPSGANCSFKRFQPDSNSPIFLIAVQTLRPIQKGEELFIDYGHQYEKCFAS